MLESLIARFRKNTLQNALLLSVVFLHFIFLIMLLFLSPDSFRKKERKHLIVRTISSQPQQKIAATQKTQAPPTSTPKASPSPPPVQKKLPDVPKPEVKKQIAAAPAPAKKPVVAKEPAIADKKLAPVKQPAPQKTSPPSPPRAKISDSLLKELEESIAKIENKSDKPAISKKPSTQSRAATPITLQIDINTEGITDLDSKQQSYTDTLTSYLHQSLSLPDYGEVKIQLSLRQDGTVAKVIVLKAKNEKNRQYLESNLPRLQFPRFDSAWANKKEHTFVLTFCNEN